MIQHVHQRISFKFSSAISLFNYKWKNIFHANSYVICNSEESHADVLLYTLK